MRQETISAEQSSLSEVKELIETWRQNRERRRPMPEKLWEAAAGLSENHTLHQISKALRLNHTALKMRVHPEKASAPKAPMPTFIELEVPRRPEMAECIIEMEDGAGGKMRMQFRGHTDFDLLELGKAFWRKGL
jgi:hypothetical protein